MIAALLALACSAGTTVYSDAGARVFASDHRLYACSTTTRTPHSLFPAYPGATYGSFMRAGSRVAFVENFNNGARNAQAVIASDDAGTSLVIETGADGVVEALGFDAAGGIAMLERGPDGGQDLDYVGTDQRAVRLATVDVVPSSFVVNGETAAWTTSTGAPASLPLPAFGCASGTTLFDDGAGTRMFQAGETQWVCAPSVRTPRRLFRRQHTFSDKLRVLGRNGDRLRVVDDWDDYFMQGSDVGWLDLRTGGLHLTPLGFVRGGVRATVVGANGDVAVLGNGEIDYAWFVRGRLAAAQRIARVRGVVPESLTLRDGVVRWQVRSGHRGHARGSPAGRTE